MLEGCYQLMEHQLAYSFEWVLDLSHKMVVVLVVCTLTHKEEKNIASHEIHNMLLQCLIYLAKQHFTGKKNDMTLDKLREKSCLNLLAKYDQSFTHAWGSCRLCR